MDASRLQRNIIYDIVRGIAITMVVITHTGFLPASRITYPLIGSWMLPIFAFIGGALLKSNVSFKVLLLSKIKRLLHPYLFFGFISFLGWIFLRHHYPNQLLDEPIKKVIVDFFMGKNIFNAPLWFLPSYLISILIAHLFINLLSDMSRAIKMVLFIILNITTYYLISLQEMLPYAVDVSLLLSIYILVGYYFKNLFTKPNNLYGIISGVVFVMSSYSNGTVDIYLREIGNPILFTISSISGIYLVFQVAESISKVMVNFLSHIGRRSMFILVTHWPIIQWITYFIFISGFSEAFELQPTITSYLVLGTTLERFSILPNVLFVLYMSIVFVVVCVSEVYVRFFDCLKSVVISTIKAWKSL